MRISGVKPAITIENPRIVRGKVTAIQDISVQISRGTITGLLGPSGSGKTTLMRCIVGTQIHAGGSVTVLGHPAGSAPARRRVGYMPQNPTICDELRVIDDIRYFAALYGVDARRPYRDHEESEAGWDLPGLVCPRPGLSASPTAENTQVDCR